MVTGSHGGPGKSARNALKSAAVEADKAWPASNDATRAASIIAWLAFLCLMVFLMVIASQSNGADLTLTGPAIASAVLGGILNPSSPGNPSSPAAAKPDEWAWALLVGIAACAAITTGAFTLAAATHPGAAGAFAASVAGLGGLLYDTSGFSIVQKALGRQRAADEARARNEALPQPRVPADTAQLAPHGDQQASES